MQFDSQTSVLTEIHIILMMCQAGTRILTLTRVNTGYGVARYQDLRRDT